MKKLKQNELGFSSVELIIVLITVGVLSFVGWRVWDRTIAGGDHIQGTSECLSWVKKIEGNNYSGIYELSCKLSPRKIANSSLTAKYLEYGGSPKDAGVCLDPGASIPPPENSQYCVGFNGIVLSDGSVHPAIGQPKNNSMLDYDYCYSTRIIGLPSPQPTIRDLYYYKGNLYDRDVFNNVKLKTPYGTCIFNGTTLSNYGPKGNDNQITITNVTLKYEGFPKDCLSATIGKTTDEEFTCIDLVTAANANLDSCHTYWESQVVNEKITGHKRVSYQATENDCETAYVQRMAALNRCQDIADSSLRSSCEPKVTHPSDGTTRVTTSF